MRFPLLPSAAQEHIGVVREVSLVHQPTIPQEEDSVGPSGMPRLMGHEDHRGSLIGPRPQHLHDLIAASAVQRTRWLIGEDEVTLTNNRPSDRHALGLTARNLVDEPVL